MHENIGSFSTSKVNIRMKLTANTMYDILNTRMQLVHLYCHHLLYAEVDILWACTVTEVHTQQF